MKPPAKNPCGSCPYRQDVPSGVWAEEEYRKLPLYDLPTQEQPMGAFLCHQNNGHMCAGWVGCHDMDENFAMRVAIPFGDLTYEELEEVMDYKTPVPLWASGEEACAHGVKNLEDPDSKARSIATKLLRKGLAT